MNIYLEPFLALGIAVAAWIFLHIDECWDEERDKKWFKAVHTLILPLALFICGFWANQIWNNAERRARQHLQTAINYGATKDKQHQLEYALKAYETEPTIPEIISYLGFAYLVQNNDESHRKGLDILVANTNRLDATGQATLGTIYYYLKDYPKSYQLLGPLDFHRVADYIFPWAVTALTKGAFETLPYDDALLKMQTAIMITDRRLTQYDVKAASSAHKAVVMWMPQKWFWLAATKFHAGRVWLQNAHSRGIQGQMSPAIRMITEGMSIPFSYIDKKDIVNYLRFLNDVLIENTGFFTRNEAALLQDLDELINKLRGGKNPPYDVEVAKLELLQNCLIDLRKVRKPKSQIQVNKDIIWTIRRRITHAPDVTAITLRANFALPEPLHASEKELAQKQFIFDRAVTLTAGKTIDSTQNFVFEIDAKDSNNNNLGIDSFCPNFF